MARRRNSRRNWSGVLRGVLWICLTVAAAGAAIATAVSPTGLQRFASLPSDHAAAVRVADKDAVSAAEIAALEARIDELVQQVDRLQQVAQAQSRGQTSMQRRIAAVENNVSVVTGSLPRPPGDLPGVQTKPITESIVPGRFSAFHGPPGRIDPPEDTAPTSRNGSDDPSAGSLHDPGAIPGQVPEPRLLRTRFGVELSTSQDVGKLQQLWRWAREAAGDDMAGLKPHVKLVELVGGGSELALIAGPIGNAKDAARLCLLVKSVAPGCKPVPFTGHALALQSE